MATLLEECATEEQPSVVRFLWAKGLDAKDNHKELCPAYGWKCLSCKAVRNCVEKRGKHFVDDEEVETEMRKSEDFYAEGSDALVKRWDKCINVGGGYAEK
jgi:hypothetical protein